MRDNLRYRVCILYFKSMSILSIRDLFLEFLLLEQHSYCCDFSSCSILSSRTWLVYSKLIRNVFSSLPLSSLRNPRLKDRNENTARINRRRKRSMKRRERKKREREKLVRSLIHLRPLQLNQRTSMNQQSRSWRKRRSR